MSYREEPLSQRLTRMQNEIDAVKAKQMAWSIQGPRVLFDANKWRWPLALLASTLMVCGFVAAVPHHKCSHGTQIHVERGHTTLFAYPSPTSMRSTMAWYPNRAIHEDPMREIRNYILVDSFLVPDHNYDLLQLDQSLHFTHGVSCSFDGVVAECHAEELSPDEWACGFDDCGYADGYGFDAGPPAGARELLH